MAFDREISNELFDDLLDYINELNETGEIEYSVYNELHKRTTDLYDSFEEAE
jgi:hypothetical protein